jgi:hypothetical protein
MKRLNTRTILKAAMYIGFVFVAIPVYAVSLWVILEWFNR